jgi:hypothetical protein
LTRRFRAYGAQEQYRRAALQPVPPDGRRANDLASTMALNRVSLQVRAAQLMASVDPARAHELFEWIDLNLDPRLRRPARPVVDECYGAQPARAPAFGAYRAEGVRFLELYLWRAHLPSGCRPWRGAQRSATTRRGAVLEGLFRWILEASSSDARLLVVSLDMVSGNGGPAGRRRALGVPNWCDGTLRTTWPR